MIDPEASEAGTIARIRASLAWAPHHALQTVNAAKVSSYRRVGREIEEGEERGEARAASETALNTEISKGLTAPFGEGLREPNLRFIQPFYLTYATRPPQFQYAPSSEFDPTLVPVEAEMSGFSPEEGIRQAAPGACVYAVAQIGTAPEQTVFLIREQPGIIAELGRAPAVHVRAGLIEDGGVLLLPVLIKVSGELYDTWMNYHAEVCPPALGCLALQEQIQLHFFDDRGARARVIAVPNHLQAFWRDTLRNLAQTPPWSLAAFEAARDRVYAMYPTAPDLWRALHGAPAVT